MKNIINLFRFYELKTIIRKNNFSLLDLGCGDGSFVELCVKKGVNALGVDKKRGTFIESLRLNEKFDVITMFHVLEHVKNPNTILNKVKLLLKDNGLLVIEVPLVGNATEHLLGKKYFAYYDQTHLRYFTKEGLINLLTKNGFHVVKKGNTLYEFSFTIIRNNLFFGWLFFLPLKIMSILGFNDEIIRLYCIKKLA